MIVEAGRLTVPLFHGSSSLHLDSIKSAGLGGRNIIEDLGIRPAAQLLLSLSADFRTEEDWLDPIDACTRISRNPAHDQLRTPGEGLCWNFRYGGTYLTPSRETAANYALLYPQGGEALSHVLALYKMLAPFQPELRVNPNLASLMRFIYEPGVPIVVEARDIPLRLLRAEQGGEVDWLLARIEEALEDPDIYETMSGQLNFEMVGSAPLGNLLFQTVEKVMEFDENGAFRVTLQFSDLRTT